MAATQEVFSAIAAPVRRQMLDRMARDEVPAGTLAGELSLSLSAASQHLAILLAAGLVSVRKNGKQRLYKTEPQPLKAVDDWVERYAPFWTDRLDSLTRHLEDTA